jgi:hypothetical protein
VDGITVVCSYDTRIHEQTVLLYYVYEAAKAEGTRHQQLILFIDPRST